MEETEEVKEQKEKASYKINQQPRLLKPDEIECRVGTISAKGCSLLLFKDARVDMKILDETYGVGNWQRTHEVINDNLFCTIEIWNDMIQQWVKKQDVGTESYTQKEKGEASDSFKRAGFNVGIGRELYTSPFIWILPKKEMAPYNTKEIVVDKKSGNVDFQNTEKEFYPYKTDGKGGLVYTTKTVFKVSEIGYTEDRKINKLVIIDNKGNIRFSTIPQEEQKTGINNSPITEGQKQWIKSEVDKDAIKEYLIKYNKSKLSELTFGQAEEIRSEKEGN